jgi:hypothetical protein
LLNNAEVPSYYLTNHDSAESLVWWVIVVY